MIKGVVEKGGSTYRRFKIKVDGKWKDHYVKLPDPTDPRFAQALAEANGKAPERAEVVEGSIAALCALGRKTILKQDMADKTRADWIYYLGLIEAEHGHRLVAELRRSHVYKIQEKMIDTPGKANVYLSKLKKLLELACQRDWLATNPAAGVPPLATGEHDPWPAEVLEQALDQATPMLRLIIVTALCSGQRISDVIRMQHSWCRDGMMQLRQRKTDTYVAIPMHPLWLGEMAKHEGKDGVRSLTLCYDRAGKPFSSTKIVQERVRKLMRDLGCVNDKGEALYSLHGLRKNACCYLLELGLSDTEAGAIQGMTPETVRHYGKQARVLTIARGAAKRVTRGKIMEAGR